MPSPGPGGSQSSLAGAVAWLTSQFRARPKPQPKKGAPIASYTMGTDPTALGGNARGHQRLKSTLLGHSASHSERLFLPQKRTSRLPLSGPAAKARLCPRLQGGGALFPREFDCGPKRLLRLAFSIVGRTSTQLAP